MKDVATYQQPSISPPEIQTVNCASASPAGRVLQGGPSLASYDTDDSSRVPSSLPNVHLNTLTAREMTSPKMASEMSPCVDIASFAQCASGIASVGLKAT